MAAFLLCLTAKCRGVSSSLFWAFGLHSSHDNSWEIAAVLFQLAARCSGVSPSLFWAFGLHSLYDNSWTIVWSCPYLAAMCNGVFSEIELWTIGLHFSSVMRYLTISTSPHWHAMWSRQSPHSLSAMFWAVTPFLLGMLVLHFLSRRWLIISNDRLQQAMCRGVSPSLFWAFGLHFLHDNSWTITSSCPYLAAMCNGVFSEVELWTLGLHPSSVMRYLTISTSPHWHAMWSRQSPSSLSGISWAVSPSLLGMLILHLIVRKSLRTSNDLL